MSGRFHCIHEAGHIVAAWLAGVTVMEALVSENLNYAAPDWKFGPRVEPLWPERDRWERDRVKTAGQAAFILMYPESIHWVGERIALDDQREFEFNNDDWDAAVAETRDDLAPYRAVIDAVADALFEHRRLDEDALATLRDEHLRTERTPTP